MPRLNKPDSPFRYFNSGMGSWLAERGVPYEQRQMLAGHSARGTTARHYEHLSPSYLKAAIEEVDVYFAELRKLTAAIKGPTARA